MPRESVCDPQSRRTFEFGLYRNAEITNQSLMLGSGQRRCRKLCICFSAWFIILSSIALVSLMIYDYAIVYGSSSTRRKIEKRKEGFNSTGLVNSSILNNSDIIDSCENCSLSPYTGNIRLIEKLNRRSLDNSDDIIKKIPQMVNSLEETNFVNTNLESYSLTAIPKSHVFVRRKPKIFVSENSQPWIPIKKTPPRPFMYEYSPASPTPFHKPDSHAWLESYRNSLRSKNIEQIVKYLNKNFAKKPVADITFDNYSGSNSKNHTKTHEQPEIKDIQNQSPINGYNTEFNFEKEITSTTTNPTQLSLNIFSNRPEKINEINLMINKESYFQVSGQKSTIQKDKPKSIFRPIETIPHCNGHKCSSENMIIRNIYTKKLYDQKFDTPKEVLPLDNSNNQVLRIMLEVYPMEANKNEEIDKNSINPLLKRNTKFHFRPKIRKSYPNNLRQNNLLKHITEARYRPRHLQQYLHNPYNIQFSPYTYNKYYGRAIVTQTSTENILENMAGSTKMLLHLNIFPKMKFASNKVREPSPLQNNIFLNKLYNENNHHTGNGTQEVDENSTTQNHISSNNEMKPFLQNARLINELANLQQESSFSHSIITTTEHSLQNQLNNLKNITKIFISTKLKNKNFTETVVNIKNYITTNSPIHLSSTSTKLSNLQSSFTQNNNKISIIQNDIKNINNLVTETQHTTEKPNVGLWFQSYRTVDKNIHS